MPVDLKGAPAFFCVQPFVVLLLCRMRQHLCDAPSRYGGSMRLLTWLLLMISCALSSPSGAQPLTVQFGQNGVQQLQFNGVVLEDLSRWPDDQFHIWHMKFYDAAGNVRTDGQYGWGENNNGRVWDAATHSWTYTFVWGTLRLQYLVRASQLDMQVTAVNRADSGVTLDGASIYPVTLHPDGGVSGVRIADGLEEPVTVAATWPQAQAVLVAVNPTREIYGGFEPAANGGTAVIASGTRPDSVPPGEGNMGRNIKPGQTDTFTVSLRFAAPDASLATIAADAYTQWNKLHPVKLQWTDRRIIGTVYLSSSGQGDKTQPAGFPTNPRRYFNDPGVDVTTPAGLAQFQTRVLTQAQTVVTNLRQLNAQGAITWDIEGEQYPQDTSYVCSPDQIAQAAPEMQSVLPPGSPYAGMKLADAFFRTIHDAGFRLGVCVRPQHFTMNADGTASQVFVPDSQVAQEMIRKMKFAHDHWGATLFYIDSTVESSGWPLPASVLEQAAAALPDSLLIPEESTPRALDSTAQFLSFIFHGDTDIDPADRLPYPKAFGVNLINDVDPGKLAQAQAALVDGVRQGDILMVHADLWQSNNATVVTIYQQAGATP